MNNWTILSILNWTTTFFEKREIETARLDAELIISHVLKIKRLELYLRFDQPLTIDERNDIKKLVVRRANREPLQYIQGEVEFRHYTIQVNNSVLIPRPETELIIDIAVRETKENSKILDIGTGSGAIAISLAKEIENAEVTAVDISEKALQTAKQNSINNNCNIKFLHSDLFSAIHSKYNLIISNPPYISRTEYDELLPELKHEPELALLAEDDGLFYYKQILEQARNYLDIDGKIILEYGSKQANSIKKLAEENGFKNITIYKDYNNFDRFICMQI